MEKVCNKFFVSFLFCIVECKLFIWQIAQGNIDSKQTEDVTERRDFFAYFCSKNYKFINFVGTASVIFRCQQNFYNSDRISIVSVLKR